MVWERKDKRWRGLLAAALLLAPISLAGCASDAELPVDDAIPVARVAPQTARLPRASWYTVAVHRGDTIKSVAARYNVSIQSVAAANNFDVHDRIYAGEMLRIPAGSAQTRGAVLREAVTAPSRNAVYPLPLPKKTGAIRVARLAPPKRNPAALPVSKPTPQRIAAAKQPAAPSSDSAVSIDAIIAQYADAVTSVSASNASQPADLAAYTPQSSTDDNPLQFIWPLSGHILSRFGTSPGGERNDGINIAAAMGAPIHAAADGVVTYAGDGIKGYGNLLLIRHDDGYVTAYAHAESLLVTRGDRVRKGQEIGQAGATGDVSEPQLHFEIRHGVKAVDPRPLLLAAR